MIERLSDAAVVGIVIAQAVMPWDPSALLNFGAVGAVLAWFLFRTEARLDRIEAGQDRMVRATMIVVMAGRREGDPIYDEAKRLVGETDANAARHGRSSSG